MHGRGTVTKSFKMLIHSDAIKVGTKILVTGLYRVQDGIKVYEAWVLNCVGRLERLIAVSDNNFKFEGQ
jgi:hypothetical protein